MDGFFISRKHYIENSRLPSLPCLTGHDIAFVSDSCGGKINHKAARYEEFFAST
jgi:hypothetical protein